MALSSVVLPTPGPPVITSSFERSASRTASRWLAARIRPVLRSTQGMACSGVDRGPGRRALGKAEQPLGDALLGAVEPGQEHAGALADRVGHHAAVGELQLQGGSTISAGISSSAAACEMQLVRRQAAVTLVHGLGQGVADAGPGADHRRLLDAEPQARSDRPS